MTAWIRKGILFSGIFFVGAVIFFSEKNIHKKREGYFTPAEARIPLSPGILRIISLNNELILSDLLYLKSLLYVGEKLNTNDTYWLYTYFDTITELDPVFEYPYITGGITLSVFCYNGELSNRILLKGLNKFPDDWRIPFLIGYNYYYELGNFLEGARYIEIASKFPDAPFWLPSLAAKLYSSAGDLDTAIEFLKHMISITKDRKIQEELKEKLKTAIVEKSIRPIEDAVEKYKKLYGRLPKDLNELVIRGLIEKIPSEPFGGYFYINKNGEVWSSSIKERFKIYIPEDLGWKLKKMEGN